MLGAAMWLPQPFSEAVARKAAAFWWLMKAISNRRYGQRVIFERGFPVVIMGIDGTWRRACTMLDASETGAKLSLEQGSLNGLELREFFLVLSSFGNAFRRCEMAWVNGDHFGAKFVEQARPPSKAKAVRQTEAIEN